jgi:hypothetical protein
MAMVSHGDERVELPLLWQLCMALSEFGYAVTVLDATACETDTNPGLEHMLNSSNWRASSDDPFWTVVPSALGLQTLCACAQGQKASLERLGQVMPRDGVVILYCNAEWLTTLIGNSHASPLLAVSSMKTSLMTSYLALKRLLKKGDLEPTVVNLAEDERAVAASLGECAKNFLGYDVKPIRIATPSFDNRPNAEVQSLALRMLENALFLSNLEASNVQPVHSSLHPAWGSQGFGSH